MPTPRNIGMTAFGILNIVFGTMGCFMIVSTMFGQPAGASAPGGAPATLLGLAGVACWTLLALSGFGLLKMAPWSAKFMKYSATGVLALTVLTFFTSGFNFNLFTMCAIGYCCACLYMCMTPQWKNAFRAQPISSMPNASNASAMPSHTYDQFRDAA